MTVTEANSAIHSLSDMMSRLMAISVQELDVDAPQKWQLATMNTPKSRALFEVLCEIKEKTAMSRAKPDEEPPEDAERVRLDNMLVAEGIVNSNGSLPTTSSESVGSGLDQPEYREKLAEIRQLYNDQFDHLSQQCCLIERQAIEVVFTQMKSRPITSQEIERVSQAIRRKFDKIQIQLKQQCCEEIMVLKSKFLDARRKRKNFTKKATEILNKYFFENLNHPYPSEAVKENLARECNITVAQVSNWFGNKRIRFKKTTPKMNEQQPPHCGFNQLMKMDQPGLPLPFGMVPPGAMMPPYSGLDAIKLEETNAVAPMGYGMFPPPGMLPFHGIVPKQEFPPMGMMPNGFDIAAFQQQTFAQYSMPS